ncbi:MAG: hypothetical protein ABJL99_23390 [Aliishimia sp.]
MTEVDDLLTRADALRQQLQDVYGVKGRDLSQALHKTRRNLPKTMRQAGVQIVQAQVMVGHPKLERMLAFEALREQHEILSAHLDQIDVVDIRRGKLLSLAGTVAFNVIIVVLCFVIWMVWAGQI